MMVLQKRVNVMEQSSPTPSKPVVVVGGGVTGLVTAQLLLERGIPVVLIEKQNVLGGLAGSFRYNVNEYDTEFVFDCGPHRFDVSNPNVRNYVERILGEQHTYFPRKSEVYFKGKYYDWPIKPQNLIQLPWGLAGKAFIDLAINGFRTYGEDNFENYILRQYGPTLYQHFFEGYSVKFLGIHPRHTHSDWAKVGINRAIIDDNAQMQNLYQLLKSTLLQFNKKSQKFVYPKHGMYEAWEAVGQRIEELGGRVIKGESAHLEIGDVLTEAVPIAEHEISSANTNTAVTAEPSLRLLTQDIEKSSDTKDTLSQDELSDGGKFIKAVHVNGERIPCHDIIWTAPITQACKELDVEGPTLQYLGLLLFNVMIKEEGARDYQWCYYGARDLVFNRISTPKFLSPFTCPPSTVGFCVEVTCMVGDEKWKHGERLTDWVIDDLIKVGMLEKREHVIDVQIERVPHSYPIYETGYPEQLEKARKALSAYSNLHLAGRTGLFWYNNMDHSIENGMQLTRRLLRKYGSNVSEDSLSKGA